MLLVAASVCAAGKLEQILLTLVSGPQAGVCMCVSNPPEADVVLLFTVGVHVVPHPLHILPSSSYLGLLLVGSTKRFQRLQLVSGAFFRLAMQRVHCRLEALTGKTVLHMCWSSTQVSLQPLWRVDGPNAPYPPVHHCGLQLRHLFDGNFETFPV